MKLHGTTIFFRTSLRISFLILFGFLFAFRPAAPPVEFSVGSLKIAIAPTGHLTSLSDKSTSKEYLPKGQPAPLLSLFKGSDYVAPTAFEFNAKKKTATLRFANGSVATVKIETKSSYLRLELLSLSPRNGTEAVVWGPLPVTINKLIGETVGIVRDDQFAIGIQALSLNTLEGIPDDGDAPGGGSFIDPLPGQKLPESLKDKIGQPMGADVNGDGDMPEYIRLYRGSAAVKKSFGSEIRFFARDRKLPRQISNGNFVQDVQPVNVDYIGTAIALFGCPEPKTLDMIEAIELGEGLPHPMLDGVWVKRSPRTADAYMLYEGKDPNNALNYATALNFKLIHIGDVFKSWGHFELETNRFPKGAAGIKDLTDKARNMGISIGVHTLTAFTGVNDPYVSPVPNDSLVKYGSSVLDKDLGENDDVIFIKDPTYFRNMSGSRTVKIGKELISYKAVSTSAPWQLTGCVRSQFKTTRSSHKSGQAVDRLINNGYGGFLPDIHLQDQYAKRLAEVCNQTGIDLMDFDGFEGLDAGGHGAYAENKFIDLWYKNLDRYRMTCGSTTSHYYWHIYSYMNWGEPWYSALRKSQVNYRIENQRYFERNLMPGMLGWFKLETDYRPEEIEWIQARSAAFNAGYLLRVEESIEKNGYKKELFTAITEWQKARKAGAFSAAQRERFKDPTQEFHLSKAGENSWDLTPITLQGGFEHKYRQVQTGEPIATKLKVENKDEAQPLQFYLIAQAVEGNKTATISNIILEINNYQTLEFNETLKAGERIVCDGKSIFICDATWNNRRDINVSQLPKWEKGTNEITIKSEFSERDSPILKAEFKSIGKSELVTAMKK
jgi:hypothetical protein